MRRIICLMLLSAVAHVSSGQSQDIQQLAYDIEKLAQMKSMLSSLYNGYNILERGYNQVNGLAKGNFDLHKTYLDGLLNVSPAVRNYKKIGGIISNQLLIVNEYKTGYQNFRVSGAFTAKELLEMSIYYTDLTERAARHLDELILMTTPGKLRMGDEERIKGIDRIDVAVGDELKALREYNSKYSIVAQKRNEAKSDINSLKALYGIK